MRPEDFDRFAEIWANPQVVRQIGPPKSRAEAWEAFLRNAGHWQMTRFGQWAINDQASRKMVGQTGFSLRRGGWGMILMLVPRPGGF
jgi:RimJ/RimL family protein N-acetyltransferase